VPNAAQRRDLAKVKNLEKIKLWIYAFRAQEFNHRNSSHRSSVCSVKLPAITILLLLDISLSP